MEFPFAVSVLTAIVACSLYFLYQKALPKPIPGIPYDEAAARNILGSLPSMISHIRKRGVVLPWFTGHNDKHQSALIQFFGLPFAKPTVIMSDYAEAQDVLLRRTKEFDRASRSGEAFEGIMPEFHLGMRSNSSKFKGNKELIRDLMSPNFLHEVSAQQIYAKSLALIDLWAVKAKAAGGRPFEAHQDIVDAALDMINAAAFAFGDDLNVTKRKLDYLVSQPQATAQEGSLEGSVMFARPPMPADIQVMHCVGNFLGELMISPFTRPWYWYRTLTDSTLRRNISRKDEIIKRHIRQSIERFEAGDDTQRSATDFIIQREASVARKENRAPDVYSKRIIDELYGYQIGGHETTSTALSWMIKLIADHQDVQHKLRQALKAKLDTAVSEGRQPSASEIAKADIPYLDAVVEESLRIGPPTPIFIREAVVDTVLLGHHIPKGVTLMMNNVGPGYRTKPVEVPESVRSETSLSKNRTGAWNTDDMDLFNPERWLKKDDKGEEIYDPHAGPFSTFGLGPRGCFGKRLAYLETRLVLTLLLWNFHFKKLEGEMANYETKESVTVMPKNCYVDVERL